MFFVSYANPFLQHQSRSVTHLRFLITAPCDGACHLPPGPCFAPEVSHLQRNIHNTLQLLILNTHIFSDSMLTKYPLRLRLMLSTDGSHDVNTLEIEPFHTRTQKYTFNTFFSPWPPS